jgi:type IV secretory pathway VirB10-like protein
MPQHPLLRFLGATALLCATTVAQAQYVWIDASGSRQYSDRPPPSGTPQHKILKSPGGQAPALLPAPASATPAVGAPAAGTPAEPKRPPTVAEQENAYRERVKGRAEQERKEAAEAQRKRDQADHCEALRDTHAQLASGMRIARVDAKGERSYMSEEERVARTADAQRALQACR